MYDVFRAGVGPGGLTSDYEIKVLICCLLFKCKQPMPVVDLINIFVSEELGNYFDTASAVSGLEKSGHIEVRAGNCALTALGKSAADELEQTVPAAARDRAFEALERYFVFHESESAASTHADIQPAKNGYRLKLTLKGAKQQTVLELDILLPDRKCCDAVAKRFAADPFFTYKGVVGLLTGSVETSEDLVHLLRSAATQDNNLEEDT